MVSFGTVLLYAGLPMLIMRAVPGEQTAAANGLNGLMRIIGQGLCSAAVASVVSANMRIFGAGVTAPAPEAYHTAFAIAGVGALLGCAAACFIPRNVQNPSVTGHVV